MNYLRSTLLAISMVVLTGCASHSFVRPAKDSLTLGKSSKADVVAMVGAPSSAKDNVEVNGEKISTVTYFAVQGAKFWGMIAPQRTLTYSFYNDALCGAEANSSFAEDSTEWDTTKVGQIVKGKSTKADVVSTFGTPSGELRYPLMKDKNGKALVYAYSVTRHAGVFSPTNHHVLVVSLDEKDIVSDVSYRKNGQEQIH